MSTPCPECGAPPVDGRDCRQLWDELLALEFSDARAGVVHFHTVAAYQLQHPRSFPLSPAGRAGVLQALRDVVSGNAAVAEVRERMRTATDGPTRVRGGADAAAPPSRSWSRTIADVGAPDAAAHAGRVQDWARAVVDDLADEVSAGTAS